MINDNRKKILAELQQHVAAKTLIKVNLSAYVGSEPDLQKLIIRPVRIKEEDMLSFTYRYKTKDIVKNFPVMEGKKMISDALGKLFHSMQLFTPTEDLVLHIIDKNKARLKHLPPSSTAPPSLSHDKQKERFIPTSALFLRELGITNDQGEVRAEKNDKYRQIDKFIEVVDSLYKTSALVHTPKLKVYDLGSGKSYLTFALYHYFTELKKKPVEMYGVEIRPELVTYADKVAASCDFTSMHFLESEIAKVLVKQADMVVALHACDTATDDAIVKGIRAHAEVIILAPCCHKYVRKHMHVSGDISELLKHGILMQRESDIVTDSLRALVLEYYGYKTQVFEFISPEATSKNVMITAVKKSNTLNTDILSKIKSIKTLFGLSDFYLDTQLSL